MHRSFLAVLLLPQRYLMDGGRQESLIEPIRFSVIKRRYPDDSIADPIFRIVRGERGIEHARRQNPSSITKVHHLASMYHRFDLNCLFNPGMFIRLSKFQLKSSSFRLSETVSLPRINHYPLASYGFT